MNLMELNDWESRSPVVATMLNPALLATIMTAAVEEFERAGKRPMPWELIFIIAPLALHRGTREALPRTVASHVPKWIADNPTLHAGFPERAKAMVPHAREGFRFAVRERLIAIDETGLLHGSIPARGRPAAIGDIQQIVRAAGFLGRWFAKVDRSSTVYAYFGVTP